MCVDGLKNVLLYLETKVPFNRTSYPMLHCSSWLCTTQSITILACSFSMYCAELMTVNIMPTTHSNRRHAPSHTYICLHNWPNKSIISLTHKKGPRRTKLPCPKFSIRVNSRVCCSDRNPLFSSTFGYKLKLFKIQFDYLNAEISC